MAIRMHGAAPPAPSGPQPVLVERVREGQVLTCRCLSDRILGVMTHYNKKRSEYCAGEDCHPLLHKIPPIWKGYIAAQKWRKETRDWLFVLLEVTESAELDMRAVYERGQVWEFSKTVDTVKKTAKNQARLLDYPGLEAPPPAFDPARVLVHTFHVLNVKVNLPNPMPSRLVLDPTPAHLPEKRKHEVG